MTDPFADLERELLAAHARDSAPRRLPRATPRVLAMVAAAAAAVFAVVWLGAATDAERAVSPEPRPAASAGSCDGSWMPPGTDQPPPSDLAAELEIFRVGRPPAQLDFEWRMIGAQAVRVYRGTVRLLPPTSGYAVRAAAADIVPGRQVIRPRDPCAAPAGATEPGACLVLSHDDGSGSLAACFTLAEIRSGVAYLDADGRIVGFAPDSAREASAEGETALVENNLFTLPGGPETKVDFTP